MNRSATLPASQRDFLSSNSTFNSSLQTNPVPRLLSEFEPAETFCTFTPVHYEPAYAYPLIVWLHGPDSREEEVHQAMEHISVRNHVAISVRGNEFSPNSKDVFRWKNGSAGTSNAAQRVQKAIDHAKENFNIHADRIFVAGSLDSGTLALRLAMENPELCNGAISLGGRLPKGSRPLKRINEVRKQPLMLVVSPNEQYQLEEVMSDVRLLHSAGLSLELRLHPEGDELTDRMLSDANAWILRQFCPAEVSSASDS